MAPTELGTALLQTARQALARAFRRDAAAAHHTALDEPGATFVTLTQHGELRGCSGTREAHRPLGRDVGETTRAAASRDPRFPPLEAAEFAITRIEVSLLSPPAPLPVAGEDDLLRRLVPGTDGVVLAWRERRATFLPQVWDTLADPGEFVAALKRKAGLAAGFWAADLRVSRYTVAKFREPEAQSAEVSSP
jgi:AmmeMemoRadiSam system protein A